jgi:hypothetical protein
MHAFFAWLEDHKDAFPPKSAMGHAISYPRAVATRSPDSSTTFAFAGQPRLGARVAHHGSRKEEFLFVDNRACGDNLAGRTL